MSIDFWEAIKLSNATCTKCLTFVYTVPCSVDNNIARHFESFGKPLYPLSAINLFRVNSKDGYRIESKLGKNEIKLSIPKKFKSTDLYKTTRKLEFEKCLAAWVSEALDILITVKR